jgi:hypothetical protein
MTWTTRNPPFRLESLFPFLKGTARKTVRLHPRRAENLAPTISKIGGAFVWPSDELRPVCPIKSCPAVPVIQLRRADFPLMEFPTGTDLLQILWYPQSYKDCNYNPKLEIRWRSTDRLPVDSVLEPAYQNHEDMFVVHECRITPEEVVEYPYKDLLPEDERKAISKWEKGLDDPMAHYQYCLSTCPGSKVGGYPDFGGQDAPVFVKSTGYMLEYLLTLSDDEWDGGSYPRWCPVESQFNSENAPLGTYLKYPLNIFLDKSISPWGWRTA